MTDPPFTPKRYEVFVLRHLIQALQRRFAGLPWTPRLQPPTEAFLRRPYFRLLLPDGKAELVWQPAYADVAGLPVRSVSHIMRPA